MPLHNNGGRSQLQRVVTFLPFVFSEIYRFECPSASCEVTISVPVLARCFLPFRAGLGAGCGPRLLPFILPFPPAGSYGSFHWGTLALGADLGAGCGPRLLPFILPYEISAFRAGLDAGWDVGFLPFSFSLAPTTPFTRWGSLALSSSLFVSLSHLPFIFKILAFCGGLGVGWGAQLRGSP